MRAGCYPACSAAAMLVAPVKFFVLVNEYNSGDQSELWTVVISHWQSFFGAAWLHFIIPITFGYWTLADYTGHWSSV
jgi:hypothetical protein